MLDDVEREENFYVYEKGSLRKKEGYYIFYEQNPKMQEYMVQYKDCLLYTSRYFYFSIFAILMGYIFAYYLYG